ncbi:MAG: hypothetical protein A2173_02775 [Planctomycetes bacterium RBG_13_44_8b]|nr:MAG: hypothetical protein A2173_02775 [Planctomycetes bacterium RBG_13_44_8b]
MEDSKLTIDDKIRIVSVTLMAVVIVVMLVFTGMSVLVTELCRIYRAPGAEIPLALQFLEKITPEKYFVFVCVVAVILFLKERYITSKEVTLILNLLVAVFAIMYFLVCVVALVAPAGFIVNMLKEIADKYQ